MRNAILTLSILLAAIVGKAQINSERDSLLGLLHSAEDDSTRIMLLLGLGSAFGTSNFDSAWHYINRARTLAKERSLTRFDPNINTAFAQYYYYNNDYQKSIEETLKNLVIAERQGNDRLLAKTYNNLAATYNHFGNYKSAIDYVLKCLALSERTGDSASFAIRNLTASNTYYNLKQYEKSIAYSKKAIAFGRHFNNSFAVMMGLNNMGAAYSDLNNIDTAIFIFGQQLDFARKEHDVVNVCYALINLCQNHFSNGDASAVERYSSMLSDVVDEIPDRKTIAEIHNVMALRYVLRRDHSTAKAELDRGIAIAKSEGATDALGNLYSTYSKYYYSQNKIREAEMYSYRYDSLQSANNIKELNFYIEDLGVQYETEKRETRLALQQAQLEQKNTVIYFLAAGTLALLAITMLSYRNFRHRRKLQQLRIDELETDRQLAATAAVLKGEEQERARLAKDLHDGLGGMLSGIKYSLNRVKGNLVMTPDSAQAFERSIDMLDSSIHEMRRVAHNMMPEILVRYGLDAAVKEFCGEINGSGVIVVTYQSMGVADMVVDNTTAVTVYRIVQELVNNTLRHAHAKNVLVQLHYSRQEKLLAVTVEDDGNGFDTARLKLSDGLGWRSIQNRVEFLKGHIDVQSSQGNGTSVMIELSI